MALGALICCRCYWLLSQACLLPHPGGPSIASVCERRNEGREREKQTEREGKRERNRETERERERDRKGKKDRKSVV